MNVIKKSISLLPLLTEVISQTIKEQVEMPADTVYRMKNNIYPDFWETYEALTYCNFLKYWKNKYNKFYDADWGSAYAQPVKDAFEKHKTDKITLRLLNTFSKIENGGRTTGGSGCYGLFQYCKEWFSSYGIKNKEEAENPDIATRQFVKYATNIGKSMSNISGKDVFEPENQWILYLGWQQGEAGTTKIYNGCEDVETFKGEELYVSTPEIIGPTNSEDIFLGKDVIEKGDANELVAFIQNLLIYNYDIGVGEDGADGVFLDDTHDAVLEFQNHFGLTPDGVIGPCTYDTLVEKRVRYCCKIGACQEDYCKDSQWCAWQRKRKEKIDTADDTDKSDKSDDIDIEEIVAGAPCDNLQLARIPNAPNAWRSGQPTAEELVWIIETYDIKHIVRMNGDKGNDKKAKCGGILTTKEEEAIADEYGVKWYGDTKTPQTGGSFYSSHGKGRAGEGRNIPGGTVPPVIKLIAQGNVLVHCRNGADRTGQMVGGYLSSIDWGTPEDIWDYAIEFNHWGGPGGSVCKPGGNWGYIKYMESFLPLRDWCEGEEWRKDCPSCDPKYIERYENSW